MIGYGRPSPITWSVTGAGAAIISTNVLTNSCPQDVTRFTWCTGAQTTATKMTIVGAWTSAVVVRNGCLLGLTLPAGLKIEIRGKRATDVAYTYALGGNALTEVVTQLADGSFACLWVFDAGLDPIVGIEISIYNSVAGSVALTASQQFEIGEAGPVFQGWVPPFGIRRDWKPDSYGVSAIQPSVQQQPHALPHREGRSFDMTFDYVDYKYAYGDPSNPALIDYDKLSYRLIRRETVLVFPRWQNADLSIDAWSIHRLAIFGYCTKVVRPRPMSGRMYTMSASVLEYPPK